MVQPMYRAECERIENAVRLALGEAAFTGAYAEEKAMTLEQAVAYALEVEDDG